MEEIPKLWEENNIYLVSNKMDSVKNVYIKRKAH